MYRTLFLTLFLATLFSCKSRQQGEEEEDYTQMVHQPQALAEQEGMLAGDVISP